MITWPKGWLRYMGIEPGDKVDVITNGDLVIRQKRRKGSSVSRKHKLGVLRLDESRGGRR